MIKTENLTRRFGDLLAVDHLSLEVASGEVFGFLGPNGAGKTTTIRMLSALIGPTEGRAWVAGHELGPGNAALRQDVGLLTESPGLYDRLSAERNLAFFAELYGVADVPGRVERYLRLLGLWDRRDEAAGTFSKGMRQKLAIARALLHQPKVLFLDEPTSGLDPEAAHLVREFIDSLRREGRTIFLCTHNLTEADELCDRVAVFNTHVVALDTPANLRRQVFGRTVEVRLAKAEPRFVEVARDLPFVQSVSVEGERLLVKLGEPESENPAMVRALVEAGAEIRFVTEDRRSLEDVYLRLVGSGTDSAGGRAEEGAS